MNYKGELGYLQLMQDIKNSGEPKQERNGGTRKLIGKTLKFDLLNDPFPLFISKKMFWRGILAELEMFINGITDIRFLWLRNTHIWDMDWKRYAQSKGHSESLINNYSAMGRDWHKEENFALVIDHFNDPRTDGNTFDLGLIYGAQWRGEKALRVEGVNSYHQQETTRNPPIDQFTEVLNSLKNGGSRRDILDAWRPENLPDMALPPCHILYQFHRNGNFIDLTVYQRSADMFLGVPFDVTSYALLLNIVCAIVGGVQARDLTVFLGDAHIYDAHEQAVNEQLERMEEMQEMQKLNKTKLVLRESALRTMPGKYDVMLPVVTEKDAYIIRLHSYEKCFDLRFINYKPMPSIHAQLV